MTYCLRRESAPDGYTLSHTCPKILADADLAKYLADKGPDGRKQTVDDD